MVKEAAISRNRDRIPAVGFFDDLRERPGDTVLTLAGGPFSCRLEGLPAALAGKLRRRWRTVAGGGGGGRTVRLQAFHAGVEMFLTRPPVEARPEEYRFEYATVRGVHYCWSYHFALQFDAESDCGVLALCRTDSPYLEETVENTLRVVFAWSAAATGGFVVHSAGVRRNGESYLFFGPSGSGKTTISGLCPAADVLHDDLCIVVPRRDGGEGCEAIGFPFLGDDRKHLPMIQELRPVAGFYRLVQSPAVGLEPIGGARAAAEIMGSLPFVTDHPETGSAALRHVARAVEEVPVFRLSFRRDLTFWELVDRERAGRGRPEERTG